MSHSSIPRFSPIELFFNYYFGFVLKTNHFFFLGGPDRYDFLGSRQPYHDHQYGYEQQNKGNNNMVVAAVTTTMRAVTSHTPFCDVGTSPRWVGPYDGVAHKVGPI